MLRVVIIFVVQMLLWGLVSVLNHHLAAWQLYLYAGGLFLLYPGLKMGPREGMAIAVLSGLLFDAHSPVGFGHNMLLHVFAFMVLLRMRIRLARDERIVQVAVAVLLNSLLYLAKFLLNFSTLSECSAVWGRLFWELLFSGIFVGLVAPWSLSLQWQALSLMEQDRFRRREED